MECGVEQDMDWLDRCEEKKRLAIALHSNTCEALHYNYRTALLNGIREVPMEGVVCLMLFGRSGGYMF